MKRVAVHCFVFFTGFALTFSNALFAQPTQLLSVPDASQPAADSGSGDSVAPIISADGRYVLFASTANNLVVVGTNKPIPAVAPAPMNVYLRDRLNATTTLVSVNSSGAGGGNDNSWPIALSTNGLYVLFESAASDLVAGDTNKSTDVFMRDLHNGQTFLVSVNTNGVAGNRESFSSAMTPDGRLVAFLSNATDLVPGDTNGISDVFVRDLQSSNTALVSIGARSASVQPSTISPLLGADGRYVVFTTAATNIVSGASYPYEIYIRDLVAGNTTWASIGATQAVQAVFHTNRSVSFNFSVSDDGRFIGYEAAPPAGFAGVILRYDALTGLTDQIHTNAIAFPLGDAPNRTLAMTSDGRFIAYIGRTNSLGFGFPLYASILVWDAQTGTNVLASADLSNHVPVNALFGSPALDNTGRFVAFLTTATNLVTNALSGDFHLYLRDLQGTNTMLIDADTNGAGVQLNNVSGPALSADGRFVAFESPDAKVLPRDSNRSLDIFVRDTSSNSTELVSSHALTLPSNAANAPNTLSPFTVSADGRLVAFSTDGDNLVANDTNNCRDVIIRDLLLGTNILVSANSNNLPANNLSTDPVISSDGRFVAFTSAASDLVPGDSNKALDVFIRDLQTGLTTLVSVNSNGIVPANKGSFSPLISTNARFVLFHSAATDLAPGSYVGGDNFFLRDALSGTTTALTMGGASPLATMTPDGRYIVFVGGLSPASVTPTLYVWDTQSSARIYTNTYTSIVGIAIAPDGHKLIYAVSGSSGGLYRVDPIANSGLIFLSAYQPAAKPGLRISANGRFLVASLWNPNWPGTNQIHRIDLQGGFNLLISHKYNNPSAPANGNSDSPDISADGRFIAYRSTAIDIVPADTKPSPDIFLCDNLTGVTTLLTASRFGAYGADHRSRSPLFSGDGKIVFFESSASDLVDQTFNFSPNIFAHGTYVFPPFPLAIAFDTQGPLLSWPIVPGRTYQAQFKNTLNDPLWQDLSGDIFFVGSTEYFRDTSPSPVLRFYRIKSF